MARASILEYLDNFRRHEREDAYVFRRGYRVQRWTYRDVLQQTYRFTRALEACGIGQGDKVLIWGENCAEWVVAFFGCLLRGAIVVPIDKIAAPDFAARVAQQVDAKLCVGSVHNSVSGMPHFDLDSLREQLAQLHRCRCLARTRRRAVDVRCFAALAAVAITPPATATAGTVGL